MYLAGVPTGTGVAAALADGSTAVLICPFPRASTRDRYHPAPAFLRAATRALNPSVPAFLRAATRDRNHSVPAFVRTAPTDSLRAVSLLRPVEPSTSVKAPQILRLASIEASKVRNVKWRCLSTAGDNTGEKPVPKVTKWEKMVALLIKLKGNILLLTLLGLSLWIGFLAVKEYPMAKDFVDVCDKAHKIYNIASKGFLIIADMLKGDNK